jgi:DnaJ-class molecular chaperone
MSSNKDYYQVLGVPKTASQDEIKQSYRKLAREHHHAMVQEKDKESAEKRFKEINEAYQVLSDPQKRKMYDQFGTTGTNPGAQGFSGFNTGQWGPFTYTYSGNGGNGPFEDFDPFDVFESFFGTRGFGARIPLREDSYYEMTLSFSDAVFGLEKQITIDSGPLNIKIPAGVRDGTELRFDGKEWLGLREYCRDLF